MSGDAPQGPDAVPGVADLRRLGFEPVEEYTGAHQVAQVWPEEHRRSVPETRDAWSAPAAGATLWLLRPPWPGWTLREAFNALWRWLERPGVEYDDDRWLMNAADFLRWSEPEARKWRAAA